MTSAGIDFSHYNSPGVYTQSVPGPQVGIYSQTPKSVGIFGQTRGYRTATESITIPSDANANTPVASDSLTQTGIDSATMIVRDPVTGTVYDLTSDYTVTSTPGSSGVTNGQDSTITITRVVGGDIPVNKVVQISYNFTDSTFYDPKPFYSYNDVVDQYGPALDASGNIISELTLAANFAFQNGASRIVLAACANPGNTTLADYQAALDQLKSDNSIAVVICANGGQQMHAIMKTHVDLESSDNCERRAMVGVDGTVSVINTQQRMTYARSIADQRVAFVSPSTVLYYNPLLNAVQTIGGHFMAAALAGVAVSINPAKPLTRMQIAGFAGIPESMSDTAKNVETQAGVMIVEQSAQGGIRVRHGVTTNFTSLLTREWSILGQQDAMVESLRNYLDNDGLIGSVIDDLTLVNVKATVAASLSSLVNSGIILGYQNLTARQLQTNPDVVEVAFEWRAAIPLNYIVVRYSINISTGSVDSNGTVSSAGDASITGAA